MALQKNKIYRCQITGYTWDGAGVGHIDGQTVFIPHTAAGDQCAIRIVKNGKNIAYGRLEELRVPSQNRIKPACPVAGVCGGCCYQHISYEEELRAKEQKVRDALTRIGGLNADKLQGIIPSPSIIRYRNKAQYPVGLDENGRIITGFYRPHSHDIVPVEQCLLQSETTDRIVSQVRNWMQEFHISPYNSQTHRGTIRHIYVRVGEKSGESQLTLISATHRLPALDILTHRLQQSEPSLTGILLNHNQRGDNVILGDRSDVFWGEPDLEDRLCGCSFLLAPEAFYQVNHTQAERLYQCALAFADLTGKENVMELYCGVGTITLLLARQARWVTGVEIVPQAIQNARRNAERNGIQNVSFLCADAGQAARQWKENPPDVLVVDPPRKGLDPIARDAILQMQPPRIIYISCDPATLARDTKELSLAGYAIQAAQAFDLFPRTSHVETVCLLSKLHAKQHIEIDLNMDELDLTAAESKATYEEIKAYVLETTGLRVSQLNIAQVKRKYGIIERANYNKPKSEDSKQPPCTPEKESAIRAALEHFHMI